MVTKTRYACGSGVQLVLTLCGFLAVSSVAQSAFAQRSFLRGDANADATVDISDPLYSLGYLFLGLSEPLCLDAADANDDGTVDISDASFTLGYLFLGTIAPPAPGPDLAGPDPTDDAQGCGPPLPSSTLLEPWSEPPAKARRNQEQDTLDIAKKTSAAEAERSSHHSLGTCEWQDIVLTGQVRRRECDIFVPGRGLDFAWVRTYRSSGGPNTAMGNGWDFSYNIWVEPLGGSSPPASVRLHDGGGRADELTRQGDGRYVAPEVLLEGQVAADGAFVITFSDQGTWRCHPLDGSPAAGKIAEIRDRTGNRLAFEYDDAGRLTRIVDTVNRPCDLAYDELGMISSLKLKLWVDANRDGTISPADLKELEERTVHYQHISRASVSGSRGDLRRVSVPITPVNDPPVVRSHTYTYSTGAADEELNHNLLTVTDESGRLQVRNEYAAVPALSYLRGEGIVHRDIAARSLAFSYAGGGGGGGGGLLTIVRDGIGNVSEYLHDERNRLVRLREYTGRADPALPTTQTENRPTGKLRFGDPEYFETAFTYNDDSILTRVTWPNGSSLLQEIEVPTAGATTLSRGNVLVRRRLAGLLGAEPAELVERFEYHPLFQRVTREIDARGNATTCEYDDAGNLVRVVFPGLATGIDQTFDEHGQLISVTSPDNGRGHRPTVTYTYSDWNAIVLRISRDTDSDGDGVPDAVSFHHDALGNIVHSVDGRGNGTEYGRNQIGEIVGILAPSAAGVPHVFAWNAERDLAGNVTRVVLRDGKDPGKLVLQFLEYDEWNRLVRRYRQAGDVTLPAGGLEELPSVPLDQLDQFVVSEYAYDAAGDLAREVLEGAGKQPDPLRNVTVAHDERRLPWRVVRGAGSADETTEQFDYSLNGLLRISTKEPTKLEYPNLRLVHDGFDRPVRAFDAMGNEARLSYDPNGNVTRLVLLGELVDGEGDAANVELQRTDYFHDAMNRCVREEAFLESDPVPEAARAKRVESFVWADCGRSSRFVDANGNETSWEYDSAGRLASVIDAGGNAVRCEYDADDNLVLTTRVDREADGTVRETPWIHRYDALDRRVSTEDAEGNATAQDYDYRSLPVTVRDALGNIAELEHDALGRCVSSSRLLKDPDTGAVIEKLTRSQTWDASSRLVAESDENGNPTQYAYDVLDRCVAMTQADGTVATARYDELGGVVEATDPNGTRVLSGFDRLHRLTRSTILPGPGVSSDTTFEEYAYDGLSRLVRASDDDSNVAFTYDLLSRVVRETLNGLETAYTHDLADNVLSIQTPGGHRTEYEYDALHRMGRARTVGAGQVTEILSRTFGGPNRLASLSFQNGVQSSFVHDPLLRSARSTHASTDAVGGLLPFDDRAYGYDAAYRKTSRQSLLPGGLAQTYDFDSADRLVRSTFGISGAPPNAITYFLDPAGDRKQVDGGPDAGPYLLDPTLPAPADRQMRQYTETPAGTRRYDDNGNLTAILDAGRIRRALEYDFAGRLVHSDDPLTQTTVRHRYDALGRRWGHEVAKGIIGNIRARVFAGPNVVEERDETGHPVAFIDYAADGQPARRVCCADLDGDGAPDIVHFFHTDDAGNVTAVTDAQGQLVERYEYGDYGRPRILDAAGSPLPESAIGNPFLLAASWHDAETGYFVVGNDAPELSYEGRHYDPHTAADIGQRFAVWPHMHRPGTHQHLGVGRGGQIGAPKKSFGQKLGSFAKGVAQVGLAVAGGPHHKKMMGAPKIGEATAVFNISQAGELLAWVETVWNKQCVEKDTTVRLANQRYQDIADDEIDSVSNPMALGGGKAQGQLGQKAKAWMVSNYEVHPVFGLKTEWITSIGLPKITPKIAKESHGKFRLPLLRTPGGDSGGPFAAGASSDKFQTTSPGHKSVGEITLRGAMTNERKALCQWINETVMGKPWKRMLTITELLSVDGGVKEGKAVWKEFSPAEEQLKGNPRH